RMQGNDPEQRRTAMLHLTNRSPTVTTTPPERRIFLHSPATSILHRSNAIVFNQICKLAYALLIPPFLNLG
ncbi:MAG TPA: hypothetical protein PLW86_04050, partial [Rhodocyclaceae bacterium]|nr:hypothetical protein [Rhodocyclaceae bacterium]